MARANVTDKKHGLVLEGGAMRGLFSAGIMDVMMDNGLIPDGIVGVSAGACFGCNVKSGQSGRVIRYCKSFANDSRFSGTQSLIRTGNIFNAEFAYHTVPNEYDIFDRKAYDASPMEFHLVVTDVESGRPVYRQFPKADDNMFEWIRASSSMPVVSKIVTLEGRKYLDGGITDSIPLEYFEKVGYGANVVILTQPYGYRKGPNSLMPVIRLMYRRYPRLIKAMEERHLMYNAQLKYLAEAERDGRCVVIRPDCDLPIGHISHDPKEMQLIYDIGRKVGRAKLNIIKSVWE